MPFRSASVTTTISTSRETRDSGVHPRPDLDGARTVASRAQMMLRRRALPASGWHSRSGPLQTVRVNDLSPPPEPAAPAKPRRTLYVLAVVFIALAAFAGSALTTCAYHALAPRAGAAGTTSTEVRSTAAVVTAIRDLATLESASFHMERVIDLRDKQSQLFGLFESQDAMLLIASADVVAGIDLQGMRDGDVSFDETQRTAWITLPEPIILSARLDNDHTYVHSRSTDTLALRAETLETRARQEAERSLRQAALEAGILGRARDNAGVTIRTLLHSLGFDHVEVAFRAE
jgi:hypothetical protein